MNSDKTQALAMRKGREGLGCERRARGWVLIFDLGSLVGELLWLVGGRLPCT